jgi:hypothetical protein
MTKGKRFFAGAWNKATSVFGNGPRQIGLADLAIAAALVALVYGLAVVYYPLGFILPAACYLAWEAFRRWPRNEGK